MPDHRKTQTNGPVHNIQEGVAKMKIEKKEGGDRELMEYPDRPGEPDCLYYLRTGLCDYGTNCRFNHPSLPPIKTPQDRSELPQREGQPDCGYYMKTATCKYGSSCKYHHPLDRRGAGQVALNTLGLPIRKEEKPCPHYMRTYACKFGPACKFDHPQPASLESDLPIPGAAAIGTMGSTLPSTGIPYVGPLPPWQLSRSSYVASSCVPGPQTYMPFVFPPLQSSLTAQNWNSYTQGNLSTISSSNMILPNYVHNSTSQVTGGPSDLVMQAYYNLPERPDQPECRFFMSTGSCKYGSNCKFHHPKERIAYNLGPHGLPFRPGKDHCSYFNSYGFCKFGPTCKYDHPMYVSYSLGMPPVPLVDVGLFPKARNMVISNSTETSNSKSTKITDWIQKPDTVISDKNRTKSVKNSVEDPHEEVHDDQPNAAVAVDAPSSKVPLDQSD